MGNGKIQRQSETSLLGGRDKDVSQDSKAAGLKGRVLEGKKAP